jgi:hypothetical protein
VTRALSNALFSHPNIDCYLDYEPLYSKIDSYGKYFLGLCQLFVGREGGRKEGVREGGRRKEGGRRE